MSTSSVPEPWRVTDATFAEIEIHRTSDRQMRIEFACGLRLVFTDLSQVPFAASLIETIRTGKESFQ